MSRRIVKQSDGKYAVWSSIVDDFIYTDCTKEEIIEAYIEEERERIIDLVNRAISKL